MYIAFKPYGLTYTWVPFAIPSNIPSGNEFKGLSKMVLKMKRVYTHLTRYVMLKLLIWGCEF